MNHLLKSNARFITLKNLQISLPDNLVRCYATHWDPKFKKLRKQKFIKVKLPDFEKLRENNINNNLTNEERRAKLIKEGISPPISFEYKPFNITTSGEIFDPYVPPEGDGKLSLFSKDGASQAFSQVSKALSKKFKNLRAIKKYDESFDEKLFGDQAQQIYKDAHSCLMNRDKDKLLEHVTEHAYGKMWLNMKFKTVYWKWIESLEAPTVQHIITREMLNKSTIYGQVTVRLHSKQILAVYDRFGRLAFGSETIPKDVLEYVVFEKHLTNIYSSWRMHDKIIPEWAPSPSPIIRSYKKPMLFKVDEDTKEVEISKFKKDESHLNENEANLN